jgi:hypothetical protein
VVSRGERVVYRASLWCSRPLPQALFTTSCATTLLMRINTTSNVVRVLTVVALLLTSVRADDPCGRQALDGASGTLTFKATSATEGFPTPVVCDWTLRPPSALRVTLLLPPTLYNVSDPTATTLKVTDPQCSGDLINTLPTGVPVCILTGAQAR